MCTSWSTGILQRLVGGRDSWQSPGAVACTDPCQQGLRDSDPGVAPPRSCGFCANLQMAPWAFHSPAHWDGPAVGPGGAGGSARGSGEAALGAAGLCRERAREPDRPGAQRASQTGGIRAETWEICRKRKQQCEGCKAGVERLETGGSPGWEREDGGGKMEEGRGGREEGGQRSGSQR